MENGSPNAPSEGLKPRSGVRPVLGLCGILFAVAGLTLAIALPYLTVLLKPEPPPEPRQKVSEVLAEAGEKFVDRMLDKVRGRGAAGRAKPLQAAVPPDRPWPLYLSMIATAVGLVGALSGTAGWIRREDHRLTGGAIVIGSLAVGWTYIVAALVIALVLCFLLMIFGTPGGAN